MAHYQIKPAADLQAPEIETILKHWAIAGWEDLGEKEFKANFAFSEFHLLTDENFKILAVARLNFAFKIKVADQVYEIAELVGLVAMQKRCGYGRKLMQELITNVKTRKVEVIGFCVKENRPFYQQLQIPILRNQAKQLREPAGEQWLVPEDDDLLAVNLSASHTFLFKSLNFKKLGFLLFS
ncbi:N-acetyltransferase [Adhaeribacter pallidiroseus]|uniref:N-acetyltransferase domain-containing protein n=1 Tax=Adhaeribacter pallidiroseus TaxID=2072847 RepID=A0A369QB87_9BACT|nr:N-acetyltransferase [Adhaeribacter pallidiroseus]RDC62181.1 hypothetical protein AHMF7616_00772 [Adhaeribacter pallidiroseus]